MIKLKTNCDDCTHKKVCKNINNAERFMEKLKKTQYDDYDWDFMARHYNVIIEFSCPDFEKTEPLIRTPEFPGSKRR